MKIAIPPIPPVGHTDWGIDRITFTYPVSPADCDHDSPLWTHSRSEKVPNSDLSNDSLSGTMTIGHAEVHVTLLLLRDRCRVELNPSRVIFPKGRELCPPALLGHIVEGVIDQISSVVWPAFDVITEDGEVLREPDWPKWVLIKRLDVARNFDVIDPDPVKAALRLKKPRYGKGVVPYVTRTGWGLVSPSKRSGQDGIYDKTAELASGLLAQAGSLPEEERCFRFEAQMKSPRIKDLRLKTLDRISDLSCWAALVTRWDATRWGTPISTEGDLFRLVTALPYPQRRELVGFLMLNAHGADDGISPSQERRMREVANRVGLTVGLPLDVQGEPNAYLDITTGRLEPWQNPVERSGTGIPGSLTIAEPLTEVIEMGVSLRTQDSSGTNTKELEGDASLGLNDHGIGGHR